MNPLLFHRAIHRGSPCLPSHTGQRSLSSSSLCTYMLPPVAYQTYLDLYAARSPHIENRKPVQCPTQHEPLACGCLGNKVCVLCSRKMLSLWAAVLTPRAHNLSLRDCLHRYVLGCSPSSAPSCRTVLALTAPSHALGHSHAPLRLSSLAASPTRRSRTHTAALRVVHAALSRRDCVGL
jgi:hypothetical protein